MNVRLWLIIPVMLIIYALVNFYIGWNGFVWLTSFFPSTSPLIYWIIFGMIALSFIVGRISMLGSIGRLLKVIGSYYVFILEYALLMLPIANLAAWGLGRFYGINLIPIVGLIVLGIFVVLIILGSWNAWSPVVRTYNINISKNIEGLHQLRIAMVSDIHLGNIVGKRHLQKFVKYVKETKPDLILLAGDIIDDSIEPFVRNEMGQVLGQIEAPFGVYAVLGNHEYYGGHREKYIAEMAKLNMPVLQDEVELIEDKFYIAGRKDRTAIRFDTIDGRMNIQELLSGIDTERPVIMMDHQPGEYDNAMNAGVDLIVSGHTHRGQFFPNHYFTKRMFELDWGHLFKEERMHAIVSSGFGTWGPPIRLGSRAEIVEIKVSFNMAH